MQPVAIDIEKEDIHCQLLSRVNSTSNYREKKTILITALEDIGVKKKQHTAIYLSMKKKAELINVLVHIFNSTAVCSLILTFGPVSMYINVIALVASSMSSIISAISTALDLETKMHRHNTANLQYTDIYRDMNLRLHKNGLSSVGLDLLVSELNIRLGLVEDNAPTL